MASFMEKLKKGMNTKTAASIEEPVIAEEESNDETEESEEEPKETSPSLPDEEKEESEEESSETEEESEDTEASPTGPEEITVEEMEQRLNENKPGGMADSAATKSLISKMIIEDEPISKKKKTSKAKHIAPKEETDHRIRTVEAKRKEWFQSDGELVVDVYELDGYMIIKSAIAGVKPEDLDISIENDTVCIKGSRKEISTEKGRNYFHQECYWGGFSREIILPVEVDGGKTEASMKNGILTIKVPKIEHEKKKISIR
jgi:HSP20 family protein